MKRLSVILAMIVIAITCGWGNGEKIEAGSLKMKGVWVSCFEFEDLGLKDQTEQQFRANADKMFKNIRANGCNAVFFHVRSHNNAIYSSAIVGWSEYISSNKKPLPYNPLKILIDSAHLHGLKFHAWLNPYRVTKKKVLDPGEDSTIIRIVNQVKEIGNLYDVDGIPMDDYFYPTNEKKYTKVPVATKKKNVNAMIQRVYQTVKAKSPKLKFGISPAGNMEYCSKIGADVKTWMSKKGFVDYVAPQLYWSDRYLSGGRETKLFSNLLAKWRSYNKLDIPMYIGLALYKGGYSVSGDPGWQKSSSNIASQIKKIRSGNTEGYILFAYSDLYRASAKKEVGNYLREIGRIKISKTKLKLKKGKKYRLTASIVWPERLKGKLRWRTSNRKIATVNKNGVVKAKKKGKVKIYCYIGSLKKSCRVTVRKAK